MANYNLPEGTQDEKDKITIFALRDLVSSLEGRLRAQRRRIDDLETTLGWEKRAFVDENERPRRLLRDVNEYR